MEFLNFNKLNKIKPEKGKILISEPFLMDDFFKRSIVLLCEHNEEGSFGFVLNNYIDIQLKDMIEDFPDFETKVSVGGPVNNQNLYYIHTLANSIPGSLEVAQGIYMGGSFEALKLALQSGQISNHEIRFFVGYSGWTVGQLQEEINQNSWIIGTASTDDLMRQDIDDLWKKILDGMGANYSMISNYPQDPNLN